MYFQSDVQVHTTSHCRFYREQLDPAPHKAGPMYSSHLHNCILAYMVQAGPRYSSHLHNCLLACMVQAGPRYSSHIHNGILAYEVLGPIVLCKTCSVMLCVLEHPIVYNSSGRVLKCGAQLCAIGPINLSKTLAIPIWTDKNRMEKIDSLCKGQ
jgi:hypothetical protein